jgi:hypothetical protein
MTSFGFDAAASTPLGLCQKSDPDATNADQKNDPNKDDPNKDNPSAENGVGDELGFGFLGTIDHEIEFKSYTQLTLQSPWQNPGTADSSTEPVFLENGPAGETDEPFGSNMPGTDGVEVQNGSLNSTADNLKSSGDTYGYNSAPASTDDVEPGALSVGNVMTWELGALIATSALIGLWLFLRAVLLTWRPSARPIRRVRA